MTPSKKDILAALIRWNEGEYIEEIIKSLGTSSDEFYKAVWADQELTEAHTRAKRVKAELDVDALVRIADEEIDPHRARLKVDVRKWVASKYNGSLYGDKVDIHVNHVVDLSSALEEAKNRAQLNSSEYIDVTAKQLDISSGCEPVSIDTPDSDSSDDIFS